MNKVAIFPSVLERFFALIYDVNLALPVERQELFAVISDLLDKLLPRHLHLHLHLAVSCC